MTVKEIKEIEKTEVKPCPFCGSNATVHYIDDLRYHHVRVGCSKCWCEIRKMLGHYEKFEIEETIKKWNTRVEDKEKQLEELKAELDYAKFRSAL